MNDSAVTQLMLVVHDYIHTIYNRGRQRRSLSADVLQSLAPTLKKPHLSVALVILKTLNSEGLFRCV